MGGGTGSRDADGRVAVLRRRAREHGLELPTTGDSMLPALAAGATVTVEADQPARFGDVVAFVDDLGNIVLHRLVYRAGGRLRCLGDNRRTFDPAVPDSRLIGRVTEPRDVLGHARHTATVAARSIARRVRRRLPGAR